MSPVSPDLRLSEPAEWGEAGEADMTSWARRPCQQQQQPLHPANLTIWQPEITDHTLLSALRSHNQLSSLFRTFYQHQSWVESVKTIRHYFPRIDKNTLSRGWADDDLNSQISKYFSLHGWEYWRYWESLQQVIHCSPHAAYYCHESVEWCSTLAIFHWCHTSQSSDLTWSTHHADPSIIAPI